MNEKLLDHIREALQDIHDCQPEATARLLGILRDNRVREKGNTGHEN